MATKKKISDAALLEYVLEKAGGREAVLRELYESRITEMAAEQMTLAEMWNEAEDDGWAEILGSMTMMDLTKAFIPGKIKTRGKERTARQKAEAIKDKIIIFLRSNPWSSRNDAAEACGTSGGQATRYLRELRNEGRVRSVGKHKHMKYAIKGTKRPPKM